MSKAAILATTIALYVSTLTCTHVTATKAGLKAKGANKMCQISQKLKDYTTYVKTKTAYALTALAKAMQTRSKIQLLLTTQHKQPTPKTGIILALTKIKIEQAAQILRDSLPDSIRLTGAAALVAGAIDDFGQILYGAENGGSNKACIVKDAGGTTKADADEIGDCIASGTWKTGIPDQQNTAVPSYAAAAAAGGAHNDGNYHGGESGCKLLSSDTTDGFMDTAAATSAITAAGGVLTIGTSALSSSPFTNAVTSPPAGSSLAKLKGLDHSKLATLGNTVFTDLADLAKLGDGEDPKIKKKTIKKSQLGLDGEDADIEIEGDDFKALGAAMYKFGQENSDNMDKWLKQLPQTLIKQLTTTCNNTKTTVCQTP
uniref:Variant surface glycoprotein n=1 Tax=Trypanosoma brucei TaxID=5691 RepID=A0A1V0FY59_9TRYP|nr:variant surface glycoprotein [Trypanosoma brucei]